MFRFLAWFNLRITPLVYIAYFGVLFLISIEELFIIIIIIIPGMSLIAKKT